MSEAAHASANRICEFPLNEPVTIIKPRKKRPPPRSVRVEEIIQVTPALLRITFGGPQLVDFQPPRPAAHIKLFFPTAFMVWPSADPDAPRPPSRTYTPRSFDAQRGSLDVEFVLHGAGLASTWAEQARIGDAMTIGGPGGGYDVPPDTSRLIIVADDSALPAAGMILESVPTGVEVKVIAEVIDRLEEHPLSPSVSCETTWLHRGQDSRPPGSLLEAAVAALPPQPDGTSWWVACEAAAMRRMRVRIAEQFGVDKAHLHTRGYWKSGNVNHPDHDYGDD